MAEITWLVQPNGCWLCNSHAKDKDGYACCKHGRIHRLMYQGEIPPNHVVRHTCDTPACINPDHLVLGRHADNVADRVARNRSATGTNNGRAKLIEEDVIAIYTNTTETQAVLASRYNVDRKVIRDIKQKKEMGFCN